MGGKYFKTSGHLLLCQHQNCQARGADVLLPALTRALETQRLAYYTTGGSVRLTPTGCLGACQCGPVLTCYRERRGQWEEAWYEAVDLPLALRVARAVHDGEDLPGERRYGPEI